MADKDTLQVEKALKQLKCSYDMYETTKKQTEKKMKEALNKDGTKKYTAEDIKEEIIDEIGHMTTVDNISFKIMER